MKKLLVLLLFSVFTYAQDFTDNIYGAWVNTEGETLIVNEMNEFVRSYHGKVLAEGTITLVKGEMRVTRTDKNDGYDLGFFVGNETLIISRPKSTKAWLWYKIQ